MKSYLMLGYTGGYGYDHLGKGGFALKLASKGYKNVGVNFFIDSWMKKPGDLREIFNFMKAGVDPEIFNYFRKRQEKKFIKNGNSVNDQSRDTKAMAIARKVVYVAQEGCCGISGKRFEVCSDGKLLFDVHHIIPFGVMRNNNNYDYDKVGFYVGVDPTFHDRVKKDREYCNSRLLYMLDNALKVRKEAERQKLIKPDIEYDKDFKKLKMSISLCLESR